MKQVTQVDYSVSEQTVGDNCVVTVRGEVDVYSAPALQETLSAMLAAAAKAVVVDLTEVGFLDSTGLGVLVAARNAAVNAGQALPIACAEGRILKLFKITGLDSVFDIHPSAEAALQSVGHQTSSSG
jgi:anti-sigma B factor antagonist